MSNANELATAIQELEKAGKLPAVLHVHTARPPFGHSTGIDYALGKGGGWHVINIHGYDPQLVLSSLQTNRMNSTISLSKDIPLMSSSRL